jgi:hypothetical protein
MESKKEFDWFDGPEIRRRLWIMLYLICALTLLPDLWREESEVFGFEGYFGFHASLGFTSCAVLILVSKIIGLFLKVKETYYDA